MGDGIFTVDTEASDTPFLAPAIQLPTGGGAVRGIDEKFATNPVNGSASLTVPIPASPGRSGAPALTLSYDSGSGNGPFGLGWSLSLPAIQRKTARGLPRYRDQEAADTFVLSGAEDLVPVLSESSNEARLDVRMRVRDGRQYRVHRYRPRIEGLFARIERWCDAITGDTFWRSISRDNTTTFYGLTADSRIADPDDPGRIFSWLICESFDDKGHATQYRYKPEDGSGVDRADVHERNRTDIGRSANRYLKRVLYGNRTPYRRGEDLDRRTDWMFEVLFDYGEHVRTGEAGELLEVDPRGGLRDWPVRRDPFSTRRAGFEVRTYRLCRRVLVLHHFPQELGTPDCLVRTLQFRYREDPVVTCLEAFTQIGTVRRDDGTYRQRALPPLELEYSRTRLDSRVRTLEGGELENLLDGLEWTDLDGEALSGLLAAGDAAWRFQPNLGNGQLGRSGTIDSAPATSAATLAPPQPADLAGDGRLDLVRWQRPMAGFFERARGPAWSAFAPLACNPNLDWGDPDLRLVDLTGDGLADVLLAGEDALLWYASLGEEGFAPASEVHLEADEERAPRMLFSDSRESIFLADLSGDGLSDLVRIRNGEACYWPSLGYGRFGRRVTMSASPWFDHPEFFDPRRIRLADVDGSGIADILYLGRGGVAAYLNLAGNGWSAAHTLECRPGVEDPASVTVLDLLGTGTACLVWSESSGADSRSEVRYVDLMSGVKPHLLVGVRNNLGAEQRIAYAPSTHFRRADREAGRAWITRLPFPVWVVERVTVFDRVSRNRFSSRYAYHHGAFDGEEREFRGFGMVEQWDTEEIGAVGEEPLSDPANEARAFFAPAVLTRTWFHTGIRADQPRVSRLFEAEYARTPGFDDRLPDTVLPPGLSAEEERQAVRALKGSILRTEVYGLDGTAAEALPYTVSEQNQSVVRLQALGPNRHAVFLTHPRESLTIHGERQPDDPRIAHAAVLEVDAYGNVLASVEAAYGRRRPDPALTVEEQSIQARTRIVHSRRRFTNPIDLDDDWRTPLPHEAASYELTGLEAGSGSRFAFTELVAAVAEAAEIPLQARPDGTPQKRLLESSRKLYRSDDLSDALPLGRVEPLALPFESYTLAFTPGLLEENFGDRLDDRMLAEDGGYVRWPEEDGWWIPSGRVFFAAEPDVSPSDELDQALGHFFLPRRTLDPFGNAGTVRYDPYDLLMLETTDAVGNRVTAGERRNGEVENGNDYRVLAPVLVSDANGNRSAVAFDALGRVAGTAVMGKPGEQLGDRLDGFVADLPADVVTAFFQDPMADPHVLLGSASHRFLYDLSAFSRTDEPAPSVAGAIVRETHEAELGLGERPRLQLSFSYSDGFGREIQRKSQAEPGPLDLGDPESSRIDRRWIATGWTIFDNKGRPVRQYEPFFDATHAFHFGREVGVSSTLFYDPPGRLVLTLRPDHTFEKIVFDAWSQTAWDVDDTVLVADPRQDPDVGAFFERLGENEFLPSWHSLRVGGELGAAEQQAAIAAEAHAETPLTSHFDPLGRPFVTVADAGDGSLLRTVVELDITGRKRAVTDARGRLVIRYDLDSRCRLLRQRSMEAGARRTLADVAGQPIYSWDDRGYRFRSTYDAARRPIGLFVSQAGEPERQLERFEYGEARGDERNLRGRLFRHFDGAGLKTQQAFDFKGNLLRGTRRLARRYRSSPDWSRAEDLEEELEDETFETAATFDALDRPIARRTPDGSTIRSHYNEAGLVERVEAELRGSPATTIFVRAVEYDAKGRRTVVEHGNGVRTTFEYDPLDFRLRHARCLRGTEALQDLTYTYDPAGNVTSIRDSAQQTLFFDNRVVEPHNSYTYDALYRLVEATGREHVGQLAAPQSSWDDGARVQKAHPHDGNAMRRYRQRYTYDAVGNLLRTVHQAPGGNWTRDYDYQEPSLLEAEFGSNRLSRTRVGEEIESYSYDPHGNMTSIPHLSTMVWDERDQLRQVSRQVVDGAATPETTYYTYGSGRVRKVRDGSASPGTAPARRAERIYFGAFELYREYAADGETRLLERETLHIGGDAIVETRTFAEGSAVSDAPRLRYQLANHLGSVALEVDEQARILSYEEHTPYGSTSYQAGPSQAEVSAKRYRYRGKERDVESGLYAFGARYYAPWLGRWTQTDPNGLADGPNLYLYVHANPSTFVDPDGRDTSSLYEMAWAGMSGGVWSAFEVGAHYAGSDVAEEIKQKGGEDLRKEVLEASRAAVSAAEHAWENPVTAYAQTQFSLAMLPATALPTAIETTFGHAYELGTESIAPLVFGSESGKSWKDAVASLPVNATKVGLDILAASVGASKPGVQQIDDVVMAQKKTSLVDEIAEMSLVDEIAESTPKREVSELAPDLRAKQIKNEIAEALDLHPKAAGRLMVNVTESTKPLVGKINRLIHVSQKKAHEALMEGQVPLKENEIVGSPPKFFRGKLDPHVEVHGALDAELFGATGGRVGTSGWACPVCAGKWQRTLRLFGWEHTKIHPKRAAKHPSPRLNLLHNKLTE